LNEESGGPDTVTARTAHVGRDAGAFAVLQKRVAARPQVQRRCHGYPKRRVIDGASCSQCIAGVYLKYYAQTLKHRISLADAEKPDWSTVMASFDTDTRNAHGELRTPCHGLTEEDDRRRMRHTPAHVGTARKNAPHHHVSLPAQGKTNRKEVKNHS